MECRHHDEKEVEPEQYLVELHKELWPWGICSGYTRPEPMRLDMSHRSERGRYKEAKKLRIVRASYHSTASDEIRVAKVFGLRGDMDEVSYGIDRPKWTGEPVGLPKGVMPSQDNRKDMRMSCKKLERAEFYSPRRRQVNEHELEAVLEELGLL